MQPPVDLRSDTVTRPTAAMKRAMVDAPLGDDVLGDDPTVKRLEAVAAERAGKEAAVFVPSGTMANLIALCLHTRPGDAVLLEAGAHPYHYEGGGGAAVAGVQLQLLAGPRGLLDPNAIAGALPPEDDHFAAVRLLAIEDTANRGGGTVYPLATLDALGAVAHNHGLAVHLDGARAFNAVVASGEPLARRAACADTLSFCFSKGLGAPVGSALCGTREAILHARRVRKRLGGGMRQSGLLAAAALYALEHHVDRLADDHGRAARLADGLRVLGCAVAPPDTNIVYVDVPDAARFVAALGERGVLCLATGPSRVRLVTHLDVDDAGIDRALAAAAEALAA
jgi:threonine aldolase